MCRCENGRASRRSRWETSPVIDDFAKSYLLGDLRSVREVMLSKLDGLSEYDVRRPLTATGTNLLGLIKHLSISEAWYFGEVFQRPFPGQWPRWDAGGHLDTMWVTADQTRDQVVDRYQQAWVHSDATIAALDVDEPGHVPWWPRPDVKLFNVMVHMLTETNRHAGHADILREQLDGAVGNRAENSVHDERLAALWEGHRAKIEQAATAATSRTADTHALGYRDVDQDPNVGVLVATMQATSRWDATVTLRSWERANLHLAPGDRLIDVGCGLGGAALRLATDLGRDGEIVGIDASAAMLDVARVQPNFAPCPVRFTVGNVLALDEPSQFFDVARAERLLQWLTDPRAAVVELARVLRPGGRISLIDTDWSTLRIEVGDADITAMVHDAMRTERRRASNVGARLGELVRDAGFHDVVETSATQVWKRWDPDSSPAPDGCFSMRSLAEDLVSVDRLSTADTDQFVSTIHDAARNGRFSMSLTMHAVIATASAQ